MAGWVSVLDERTPPRPEGIIEPGPWRTADGVIMHGLYRKSITRQPGHHPWTDGVAIWHGWLHHQWAGPQMPFSSVWVSPLNEILSQGLGAEHIPCQQTPGWSDTWTANALLSGLKPFGRFTCTDQQAHKWIRLAGAAGLAYNVTPIPPDPAEPPTPPQVRIIAALTLRYREIFDLPALSASYQMALSPGLAGPHVQALKDISNQPISMHVLAPPEAFEAHARAVRGLTLGYDPTLTAARILAEAART
ncbi:hypothetical protein [Streptosporangium canum]|uniref:hypothetical protein n=1 Tax=Streptosporangium canum TaxID=324952 RepID=UPI00379EC6FA